MSVYGYCAFCSELLDEVNSTCSRHERQRKIAEKLVAIGHDPEITRCGNCGAVIEISGPCWNCSDEHPLDYLKDNPDIELGDEDEEPGDGTNDDGGIDEDDSDEE